MFTKVVLALLAASSVFAAPGNGDSWGGEECSTTCSTELCTQSSVYEKTTEILETKTVYIPVTNYATKTWDVTKVLTSTTTKQIVTSTPYTTVIWKPVTSETCIEVPYTTVCEEETTVPVVTSSASASVCTEEKSWAITTQWVETSTICSTITPPAQSWGAGSGWGSSKAGW